MTLSLDKICPACIALPVRSGAGSFADEDEIDSLPREGKLGVEVSGDGVGRAISGLR